MRFLGAIVNRHYFSEGLGQVATDAAAKAAQKKQLDEECQNLKATMSPLFKTGKALHDFEEFCTLGAKAAAALGKLSNDQLQADYAKFTPDVVCGQLRFNSYIIIIQ